MRKMEKVFVKPLSVRIITRNAISALLAGTLRAKEGTQQGIFHRNMERPCLLDASSQEMFSVRVTKKSEKINSY